MTWLESIVSNYPYLYHGTFRAYLDSIEEKGLIPNFQNNFVISWRETNVSSANAKASKVPVIGSAVSKEDCNFLCGFRL